MRIIYRPKKTIVPVGGYGLLYNWYATQEQQPVKFGALYNWYAATDARGFVSGWHVPTYEEYDTVLSGYLGGITVSGGHLKEVGTTYWTAPNTGADNSSGFNGRPSGYRYGLYNFVNTKSYFWTTSEFDGSPAFMSLAYDSTNFTGELGDYFYGAAIRLIKDDSTWTAGDTVIIDGHEYSTIKIGTQVWMAENLNTRKYANGDWITGYDAGIYTPIDSSAWGSLTTEAMCYYDDDESLGTSITKITSSDDWVVPTKTQWEDLLNSIDTYDALNEEYPIAGGKLKETGLLRWNTPNDGATNELGFTSVGGGFRDDFGFSDLKESSCVWSSSYFDNFGIDSGNYLATYAGSATASVGGYTKWFGRSMRLCNPSTALSEGATGIYTDNFGNVYGTKVINGVEFMTSNLKERKYRDGSWIHGFDGGTYTEIDDVTWAALTTPALCVYNNDLSNI